MNNGNMKVAPECLAAPGANETIEADDFSVNYNVIKDIEEALPPVCNVEEIASFMSMKPSSVRELCRSGSLRAIKAGALWRIPRAWLLEFVLGGGCDER